MAILEDNAAEFGVTSPESDYNEEIYAPVRLSNSTRRMLTPTEQAQQNVNMYSPSGRMMREQEDFELRREKELLAIDQMQDEAIDREITKRTKAAMWNDKVRSQQQAGEASQALIDLDPTQPDYQTKVDSILKDRPLARLNPQVSSLLEGRGAIYTEAQKERERLMALEDRKAVSQENIFLNQQMSRETADINNAAQRQAELRKETDKMGPAARAEFNKRIQETGNYEEAATAARDIQDTEVTPKIYETALQRVNDLNRSITSTRKTIADLQSDVMNKDSQETKDLIEELQSGIVGYKAEISSAKARYIDPFNAKFGGDKKDDAAPKPAPTGKMSVKSLLPGSK